MPNSGRPSTDQPAYSARSAILLCGLILVVVCGAGVVTYRQGRATLQASNERRLSEGSANAESSVEHALAVQIAALESWASQPVMGRILDDDADHEIAELLGVLVQQSSTIAELTCANVRGDVIASTDPNKLGRTAPELTAWDRTGRRYEIATAGERLRFVVPIFIEFDERELVGVLAALVRPEGLLVERRSWWVGLVTADGEVMAERGPRLPARLAPDAPRYVHPEAGPLTFRAASVQLPPGGRGPRWRTVIAEPNEVLLGPISVLRRMVLLVSGTSGLLVVGLVVGFTRKQMRLLTQLAHRRNELEQTAGKLESANAELTKARGEALAAARAKSEFLANMSHEIRTPMTAILGFADVLLEEGDLENAPPERLNAARTIKRNGEYLLDIINDILDISKIEAGKMKIERVAHSPPEMVAEVQSLMQVRADKKGLKFGTEFVGEVPETVQADPTRLRQILLNLIGNAIKFTEKGGVRLVVRFLAGDATGAGSAMQYDVIDTGLGMTSEQCRGCFDAFRQADMSTTRKFGGTGLGLSISKKFARLLGGDLTVQSEVARGSTFRLTLPTGPLQGVNMIANPAVAVIAKPETRAVSTSGDAPLNCRILLAEDGPDNQRLISHVLKRAGAEVTIAENGQVAVDAVMDARDRGPGAPGFDIILMDMQMPVMDGYKATRQLRERDYTGPIIALTAHAMASDREKCLEAGCDEYATKPIDRKKLMGVIRGFLASADAAPEPVPEGAPT